MSDRYGYPASVEVGPEASPGESRARRLRTTADRLLERPAEGVNTTWDIINHAARTYGDKPGMGWREVLEVVTEESEAPALVDGKEVLEKRQTQFLRLSDYRYLSFSEVRTAVSEIARGLLDIGIQRGEVFNIYSRTSIEWQLIANGCAAISTPVATAYDSLGVEGLAHSLNEPGCVGLFTNTDLLPTVLQVLPDVASVRIVVYEGRPEPALLARLAAVRGGIQVLSLAELRAVGRMRPEATLAEHAPRADTVALIMYTSGSTGAPKGVVIKQSNLAATVASLDVLTGQYLQPDERYLAYLPLAHILEFVTELNALFHGVTIGYGRVKTLTDASVRGCQGDLTAFRPTTFVGVPAVWEGVKKGIIATLDAAPSKRRVVNAALAIKTARVPLLAGFVDRAVLAKLRAATGGAMRAAISGGAPLSPDTQAFMGNALLPIQQGYGLTETCGMCAMVPQSRRDLIGVVGVPMPSTEIKLIDVPEVGYKARGSPPQGEICIRGPSVVSGYFKRPDLNSDRTIFTEDGWFRTGDVGQWNSDGTLSIIDRVKNLIKLEGGEYIALERLEATYKSANVVGNICVYAEPGARQPIAVIFPHEVNLRLALGASKRPLAELCADPAVRALVLKACNAAGTQRGFRRMELLAGVILTPDEWTPESGLVTAAQKLQRKKVAERFAAEIKGMSVARGVRARL